MIFGQPTRGARKAGVRPAPQRGRRHHPDFDRLSTQGWKALEAEGQLSRQGWRKEQQWALDMGLPGAECLTDKTIPTFARGELPHFAGINTFLKAPYVENVRDVGKYDAAVIGIPFDSGTTYRPGTRFGPQGIRRISALYNALQLRARRRSARADDAVRRRRRVHDSRPTWKRASTRSRAASRTCSRRARCR